MLPPPVPTRSSGPSSPSHSSRKRKRTEADSSVASSVASSASSSTQFTKRTRQRIIDTTGGKCWHCAATPVDVCHVIGQRDSSFGSYVGKGLITFDSLEDEANAIPLCPTCHRNFDDVNDPGLLFIPTDIQYFIDYENRDFEGRARSASINGYVPPRSTPNPQEYRDHQIEQGDLPPTAHGGLYWRYTLRDYFPLHSDKSFIPGVGPYKEPGIWGGAPMAALKRAFQSVFSPNVEGIPEETLDALLKLKKLYGRRVEVGGSSSSLNLGDEAAGDQASTQHPGPAIQPSGTASNGAGARNTGEDEPASSTANATENEPLLGTTQAAPLEVGATPELQKPASLKVAQRKIRNTTTCASQRSYCSSPQPGARCRLLKWGAGSTAESNVVRFLAMLR